jgi:hypothetical protein
MNPCAYITVGPPNSTSHFHSSDDGINNVNPDWTEQFDYEFNSLGFRGIDFLPGTDHLVTFGCSHTVGIGIPQKARFGDQLGKDLDMKHLSFASGGADMLTVLHNINCFLTLSAGEIRPKLAVILWPSVARFTSYTIKSGLVYSMPNIPNDPSAEEWKKQFIVNWAENVSFLYLAEIIRSVDIMFKAHNIELMQMSFDRFPVWPDVASLVTDVTYNREGFITHDQARDYHPGPITHRMIADSVLRRLNLTK